MVVRKPQSLKESTDLTNDSVLDGDGAEVKTSVLDEDEVVADINDDGDVITTDDDILNEDDTADDMDDIDSTSLDELLHEADDEEDDGGKEDLDEAGGIANFKGKQAEPFTAEDAKKAHEKKEAEEKDDKADADKEDADKEKDGEGGDKEKDDKTDKDDKDDKKDGEKDDKGDLKEDFVDDGEFIDPVLYDDTEPVVEEFGEIPDAMPMLPEEPIIDLSSDDTLAAEVDIDDEVLVPSYDVEQPFILPESRTVVVGRGDKIFLCGKAEGNMPSFAESTFSQAAKMLVKAKKMKGTFLHEGKKNERVALIGRSCLVEVAKDWRLPGTETIFEKGDIIQIVSRKQVTEKEVKIRERK